MCNCTAIGWCEPCRQAFLTGPVAADWCDRPAYSETIVLSDVQREINDRLDDPYATHRENARILRGQLTDRIAEIKAELAQCEEELRRLG